MNRFIVMILVFFMAGCAITLTEEESVEFCPNGEEACLAEALEKKIEQKRFEMDYNRGIDLDNWTTCLRIYEALGEITYHINHTHSRTRAKRRIDPWDVKSDLRNNNCRMVIRQVFGKDGWAEHY